MIPLPLLGKFDSQTFVSSIEISQMIRHCSKTNKFRNVNTIRKGTRNVAIQNEEINTVKNKLITFVINIELNKTV